MDYNIKADDLLDLFNHGTHQISVNEKKVSTAVQTIKGNTQFNEEFVRNDLLIFEAQYNLNENIRYTGRGDEPLLEMQFNLSTEDIFYKNCFSCTEIVCPMSGNLIYDADNENAQIRLAKDVIYNTFDIHLPISFLNEYAGENKLLDHFLEQIQKGRSGFLSDNRILVNPKILSTINDMKSCVYSGLTRRIYLESKILELVALSIDSIENNTSQFKLTPYEKRRILETAQTIREHIAQPYTIVDLANMAGINQTKLKQGFKELMGNTIFGYLQGIRMEQAKRYLLDTDLPIQEISNLSGYTSLSNFSLAFKKVFGTSPSSLRKGLRII